MKAFLFEHRWWFVGASLASAFGLLSMGLVGGGLMALVDGFFTEPFIASPRGWHAPHGDTWWPTAILYSLVLPWWVFGVALLLRWKRWKSRLALAFATALGTAAVFVAMQVLYRWSNRTPANRTEVRREVSGTTTRPSGSTVSD